MADIIHLLPDSVVNQIAAGEVIQRPSSVVKELMDNAIDSGANEVKVVVKQAGKELILVQDNGCGMTDLDARMSFERHATSKIRTSEDLFKIQTMGFRGEALASIAAVSRVDLKTKRHEDSIGTRILIQDSKIVKQEACSALNGTQIQVSDLFFSVPARKKFLKSDAVELRHIQEEFIAQALAHPETRMSFTQNDHVLYSCQSEGLKQRINSLFGKKYGEHLIEINQETDIVNISGYVGDPEIFKKSRGEQYLFINRRLIKSNYLHHAIASTYDEVLAKIGYPFYVLFLQIDPTHIDINVHPTKHEIKFDDERLIYNFLKVSIKQALGKQLIAPALDFDKYLPGIAQLLDTSSPKIDNYRSNFNHDRSDVKNQYDWKNLAFPQTSKEVITEREHAIFNTNEKIPEEKFFDQNISLEIKPIQIFCSYIMFISRLGITFIDQQSAHERILYESFKKNIEHRSNDTQKLLFPQTIHLNKIDSRILSENLDLLNKMGIEIESFGSDSFIIHALPSIMEGKSIEKDLLLQFIDQYKMNLEFNFSPVENTIRSLSTTNAVRRGKALSEEEMTAIIEQLFLCQNPNISPFGKKCIHIIKLEEFNKIFNN